MALFALIVVQILHDTISLLQQKTSVSTGMRRSMPRKINVEGETRYDEATKSLSPSFNTEDEHLLDTFWILFSTPSSQSTTFRQENSIKSVKNTPGSLTYAYRSIEGLIGDAPSFEALSNNIKSIPTESKVGWLPGIDAWRNVVRPDEQDVAPPSLVSYLDGTSKLSDYHVNRVSDLMSNIKRRGSFSKYSKEEADLIAEALRIAYIALWGKKTQRSMEVSINRACGTAVVLGEMEGNGCPLEIILAGILHDVVSECSFDCLAIRDGIEMRFGARVLNLIENYIKLPKFKALKAEYTLIQSEHMIQMLVATCEEYQTLYIRLADRLHTLRNLRNLPLEDSERVKIAQEAINVYAPLAHKMSLIDIKHELEDLAFRVINPEMYVKCKQTQTAANKAHQDAFTSIKSIISKDTFLKSNNAKVRLSYRVKSKYQLYLKMTRKNLKSLSDVKDALGLRLIIDTKNRGDESQEEYESRQHSLCYHIVEQLKCLPGWKPEPNGTKDYIKDKKDTGYQSIHQFLIHESLKVPVEVQVRTMAMHYRAEIGEAAHWYYKDLLYRPEVANSKFYNIAWRSPEQIQANSPASVIGLAKEQLKNRVFVFMNDHATVLNLKKGSTCLDAAFNIHSKLGLSTSFVKVNGRPVELSRQLRNSDVINVESALDNSITAKPFWLEFVKTRTAQNTLKSYFRGNQKSMLAALGCVQFMMTISSNIELIVRKFRGIPNASDFSRMVRSHTSFSDLAQLLIALGDASREEIAVIMSDLLDIPKNSLEICTPSTSLVWAKMQGKNGWADKRVRNSILLPILNDLLPSLGVPSAQQRWCDLVGPKSLTNEQSPYFEALSSHLKSSRKSIIASSLSMLGQSDDGSEGSFHVSIDGSVMDENSMNGMESFFPEDKGLRRTSFNDPKSSNPMEFV